MNKRGFSLIELLLVLALAPIVFFAVYSNFSTGVKIWQRLQRPAPEEDVQLFAERSRHDFENAMRFSAIVFTGDSEEVQLATGVDAPAALGGERGIGQVKFYYDSSRHAICREVKNYSEWYRDAPGTSRVLLTGVREFKLSYQKYDVLANGYVWTDSFRPESPGDLPYAVTLTLGHEASGRTWTFTYPIASGGHYK